MQTKTRITRFLEILDIMNQGSKESTPGIIVSSPGSGKTTILNLYAKAKGYGCLTLIASQYAPDDVAGLQTVSKETETLKRLKPDWYMDLEELSKKYPRVILFIDELTTCNEYIQSSLLDVITSRKVGHKYDIPENVLIVAAGNYADQLNNEYNMMAPTVNRFLILNIQTSFSDFKDIDINKDLWSFNADEAKNFLGMTDLTVTNNGNIDINRLADFLDGEIYGPAESSASDMQTIQNSAKTGLLGVATNRSYKSTMRFVDTYNKYYVDGVKEVALAVMGDTLGVCPLGTGYVGKKVKNVLIENMSKIFKPKPQPKSVNNGKTTSPNTNKQAYQKGSGLSNLLINRAMVVDKESTMPSEELIYYYTNYDNLSSVEKKLINDYANNYPQDVINQMIGD